MALPVAASAARLAHWWCRLRNRPRLAACPRFGFAGRDFGPLCLRSAGSRRPRCHLDPWWRAYCRSPARAAQLSPQALRRRSLRRARCAVCGSCGVRVMPYSTTTTAATMPSEAAATASGLARCVAGVGWTTGNCVGRGWAELAHCRLRMFRRKPAGVRRSSAFAPGRCQRQPRSPCQEFCRQEFCRQPSLRRSLFRQVRLFEPQSHPKSWVWAWAYWSRHSRGGATRLRFFGVGSARATGALTGCTLTAALTAASGAPWLASLTASDFMSGLGATPLVSP